MSKKVRVVVKRVGQEASVEMIEDTLEARQAIVAGWIEVLNLERHRDYSPQKPPSPFDAIAMVINEEGMLEGLPENFTYPGWVPMNGNVFFDRTNHDGDAVDLTDADIKYVMNFLSLCRMHPIPVVNSANAGFGKSKLPR